ncbi:hypothetical protein ASPFODRAFT_459845 [Aspergillus luchuensis CBS 106.47]|uniref:Uncharacterized protein n=1 Tax=Aspergillus luchuensis (strain CBS 106.47) TaxID=1137211 RepID=A0A1M3T0M0_ASPLC|nr:hypothetical protein ASPFODRAFT_459845 [Aspergillus luchuensis CBS 106.47]
MCCRSGASLGNPLFDIFFLSFFLYVCYGLLLVNLQIRRTHQAESADKGSALTVTPYNQVYGIPCGDWIFLSIYHEEYTGGCMNTGYIRTLIHILRWFYPLCSITLSLSNHTFGRLATELVRTHARIVARYYLALLLSLVHDQLPLK